MTSRPAVRDEDVVTGIFPIDSPINRCTVCRRYQAYGMALTIIPQYVNGRLYTGAACPECMKELDPQDLVPTHLYEER